MKTDLEPPIITTLDGGEGQGRNKQNRHKQTDHQKTLQNKKYIFFKNQKFKKFFWLARAIHREHFLLQCLKKEIATSKVLDLRPLGKVIIFRVKQTEPSYYI